MMNISKKRLFVLGFSVVLGGWLGYLTGAGYAAGGINAMFAIGGVILAGVILIVYGFVGLLLAKQPDGTGGPLARATFTAAGVFASGFAGGWVAVLMASIG